MLGEKPRRPRSVARMTARPTPRQEGRYHGEKKLSAPHGNPLGQFQSRFHCYHRLDPDNVPNPIFDGDASLVHKRALSSAAL